MTMTDTKSPQFLAFWTKCLRNSFKWSQEALAEAAGFDVRTVQRIEAGRPVTVTTRRSLAKGLGYDNPDIFENPEFISGIETLFEGLAKVQDSDIKKQHPDHIRVEAKSVTTGDALARLVLEADAYLFNADESLPDEAKEVAASIFDYLRDLGDVGADLAFSDGLQSQRELDERLQRLRADGAACYCAFRSTKITGDHWVNKTPLSVTIGYLTVVPAEMKLTDMLVPRRLS